MHIMNKKLTIGTGRRISLRIIRNPSVNNWNCWISGISIALFLSFLCSTGSATNFVSGHQYTFEAVYNENYIYKWSASAGNYQDSDKSTFTWTSPDARNPEDVIIHLSVTDKTCSCHSTDSKTIAVLPLEETKLDTKALSNDINSTIIENNTDKSKYLLQNVTENISEVIDKNTTGDIAGNITERATTLFDNTTSGDNATSALARQVPSQNISNEYTYEQTSTKSENNTTSTTAREAVPQQVEATQKAPTLTGTQSEDNKTTTLVFGDNIKVELVSQKVHLLDNYLVINKTEDISNEPYSATKKPDPATGQTKIVANQSNKSIDQTPIATNSSVLATSQLDAVSNQTTLSDNQSELSKGLTQAIEIKPELIANQSNIASNQPNIGTNQSTKSEDQTPTVEIIPVLPTVQPSTASNQTETGASQPTKSEDKTTAVEIMPILPAIQPGPAMNQTETAASQSAKPKDQTPVVETKPAIQADQLNAVPAQQDNGASMPDTLKEQTPVVESTPAAPDSQPSADINQTKPTQIEQHQ